MNIGGGPGVQQALAEQLLHAAQVVEAQVEEEINRFSNLQVDDLEKLREDRLNQLKAKTKQVQEWKTQVDSLELNKSNS